MSVSIISCPSCKNLVLSDTVQCPTCQHVLKPEHANANAADLPAVVKAAEDEVECPDCGEQVRSGLVRCWRCGGFLREDIAEKYQKMLEAGVRPTGPTAKRFFYGLLTMDALENKNVELLEKLYAMQADGASERELGQLKRLCDAIDELKKGFSALRDAIMKKKDEKKD